MSEYESLKEKLFNNKKCGWEGLGEEEKQRINTFGDEYIQFLNKAKTEREAVDFAREVLQKNGFVDLRDKLVLEPGDKVYYINREKSVYIVNGFLRLTREEAIAINWHMGGFDKRVQSGELSYSVAYSKYPLAVLLHLADVSASYLDEQGDE